MKRLDIPKEWLEIEFVQKKRTAKDIALELKCNPETVYLYCKKYSIKKPLYDLKDCEFGDLIVIEKSNTTRRGRFLWKCKCKCGNEKFLDSNALQSGNNQSCGCWSKRLGKDCPSYKGYGEIFGELWVRAKTSAKKRDLEFNITIEYAWELFLKQDRKCALSGREIQFGIPRAENRHSFRDNTASLDRIDSSKGYIEGNVQWVDKWVNLMKLNHDEIVFIEYCKDIYLKNKKRLNEKR